MLQDYSKDFEDFVKEVESMLGVKKEVIINLMRLSYRLGENAALRVVLDMPPKVTSRTELTVLKEKE